MGLGRAPAERLLTRVAVVLGCSGSGARVLRALDAVRRQTVTAEIVLAELPALQPVGRRAVAAAAERFALPVARAAGGPGAVWNAAVRLTRAPLVVCVEDDDRLLSEFAETLATRLDDDRDSAVAAAWSRRVRGHAPADLVAPTDLTLTALLRSPWSLTLPVMLRRSDWERAGGFDHTLPALEVLELAIRLAAGGRRASVVERVLAERELAADTRSRSELEDAAWSDALAKVIERHRTLYENAVAELIVGHERDYRRLVDRHLALVERRRAVVDGLRTLDDELKPSGAAEPRPGTIDWGQLRRTTPVSRTWGFERGTPVDRYYIEQFLAWHAADIRGHVLEVQEPDYAHRFGAGRVERVDVLDVDATNPRATIVADLRSAPAIAPGTFDCIVLTQTLHVIDDMPAVVAECSRLLRPGGVLLATLPAASRVCREYGEDGDYWRVTEAGARRLVASAFGAAAVEVRTYGNVLANVAFLHGLASHELEPGELDDHDPYFPLVVAVRAVKPGTPAAFAPASARRAAGRGLVLLYHRVADAPAGVHGLVMSPLAFREQMRHVRRALRPVSLGALAAMAEAGDIPPGTVAVTFDDGYVDNLDIASPVLVDLGIPATFFVTTAALDGDREYWWDTLERVLLGEAELPSSFAVVLDGAAVVLPTATAADRSATHARLHGALVALDGAARDAAIARLVGWSGLALPVRERHRPMNRAELRRLVSRPGHDVGAHGVHHVWLPSQAPAARRREVTECRDPIAAIAGRPVDAFAYPFGAADDASVEAVRAAGYRIAVTRTHEPTAVEPGRDRLRLPRVEIQDPDPTRFVALVGRVLRPA